MLSNNEVKHTFQGWQYVAKLNALVASVPLQTNNTDRNLWLVLHFEHVTSAGTLNQCFA